MIKILKTFWQNIRQLSGDDAYERYLKHYAQIHAVTAQQDDSSPPLNREAFFKEWQDGKWKGIKRCC